MARVLLLGRSGQVGGELLRLLPSQGLAAPERAQADLARPESLREAVRAAQPRVIVNAAAYTAVDAAERDEDAARLANGVAPGVLAEEATRLGALLIHYSTDYVFDGTKVAPYVEDDATAPVSAYGRTKLEGERAVRAAGGRHLILRTSWVYAPSGKNFLRTMLRLAGERDELRVVADQVGAPTSARALAVATARLIELCADRGDGPRGTYHMTCAGQTSWHGFASRIVARGAELGLCRAVPVRPIATADYPTPARRPAYSVLDNGRLRADFGVALPPWEAALEECLGELGRA
jgi:dTDP-4-dehydrorhamnose reductase